MPEVHSKDSTAGGGQAHGAERTEETSPVVTTLRRPSFFSTYPRQITFHTTNRSSRPSALKPPLSADHQSKLFRGFPGGQPIMLFTTLNHTIRSLCVRTTREVSWVCSDGRHGSLGLAWPVLIDRPAVVSGRVPLTSHCAVWAGYWAAVSVPVLVRILVLVLSRPPGRRFGRADVEPPAANKHRGVV
ncbi:hypothetical protein LX36DRAFT_663590 [Colletotrichum falcatum]|nr:hypothetical protein LX36DRAFT_663590 [Colletotrichum falcatum]